MPFILCCQKVLKLLSAYMRNWRNNNLDKHFSYKISVELIFNSKFRWFYNILLIKSEVLSHKYPVWILYFIPFLIYGLLIVTHRKAHGPFIVLNTPLKSKKQCHKRKLKSTIRPASQRLDCFSMFSL